MKRSRMVEMSMEVTVGAFMFMVLLALGFFTIILSTESFFQKDYKASIRFEKVMGLREGDNVYVRGVDIGKVVKLRVEKDGVYVNTSLTIPLQVRSDYRIEILPRSVLGGRFLNIDQGSENAPVVAEGTLLQGTTPVDLIDEASETISMIRGSMEEGGILKNLETTMENVSAMTEKLSRGEGTIGKLLMDDTLYNEFATIADDLRQVSTGLAEGKGTLGKLLADDTLYKDIQQIADHLKSISGRLESGEGTLGKLLSSDDQLYQDLSKASANIQVITERIAAGEGTLGKLMTDDAVYEQVKLLLEDARATVDDIRETSPITTFTSIFFGAF